MKHLRRWISSRLFAFTEWMLKPHKVARASFWLARKISPEPIDPPVAIGEITYVNRYRRHGR